MAHEQGDNRKERLSLVGFLMTPRHLGYKPRNMGGLRGKGDRKMNKKEIHC